MSSTTSDSSVLSRSARSSSARRRSWKWRWLASPVNGSVRASDSSRWRTSRSRTWRRPMRPIARKSAIRLTTRAALRRVAPRARYGRSPRARCRAGRPSSRCGRRRRRSAHRSACPRRSCRARRGARGSRSEHGSSRQRASTRARLAGCTASTRPIGVMPPNCRAIAQAVRVVQRGDDVALRVVPCRRRRSPRARRASARSVTRATPSRGASSRRGRTSWSCCASTRRRRRRPRSRRRR